MSRSFGMSEKTRKRPAGKYAGPSTHRAPVHRRSSFAWRMTSLPKRGSRTSNSLMPAPHGRLINMLHKVAYAGECWRTLAHHGDLPSEGRDHTFESCRVRRFGTKLGTPKPAVLRLIRRRGCAAVRGGSRSTRSACACGRAWRMFEE